MATAKKNAKRIGRISRYQHRAERGSLRMFQQLTNQVAVLAMIQQAQGQILEELDPKAAEKVRNHINEVNDRWAKAGQGRPFATQEASYAEAAQAATEPAQTNS
jgi:erythromycin esterase-like protein